MLSIKTTDTPEEHSNFNAAAGKGGSGESIKGLTRKSILKCFPPLSKPYLDNTLY